MSLIASGLTLYDDFPVLEVRVVDEFERLSKQWIRREDLITAAMDGEVLMMDGHAGVYYGLDAVGGQIWQYLVAPMTIPDLVERLAAQYEVEPERCTRDVTALIDQLSARNMVKPVDA